MKTLLTAYEQSQQSIANKTNETNNFRKYLKEVSDENNTVKHTSVSEKEDYWKETDTILKELVDKIEQ